MKKISILFVISLFAVSVFAEEKTLRQCADEAWEASWKKFYVPKTHQFYDYLISYEPGKELSHLPTAEETARQFPNVFGYGTGMEDCMISAGVMLDMIVDRYAVTKEENLRVKAKDVFLGVKQCTTVHGVPGFLARGVCPADGKGTYPNSSRDQYTHAVHGLWLYFRSPLCDDVAKKDVAEVVAAIADRMIRNVTPGNDYDSLRSDGSRDTRGISRMWNVDGHEWARLPMIYAAAWDMTEDQKYFDEYQKYVAEAVEKSFTVKSNTMTYAFLQMQDSMELLKALETDDKRIEKMNEIMAIVSRHCADRAAKADKLSPSLDLTLLTTDWRTGEGLLWGGNYRKVWYNIRESGEAALTQLMDDKTPFPEEQKAMLARMLRRIDYDRVSSNGIFYLQGAYWKARKRGVFTEND